MLNKHYFLAFATILVVGMILLLFMPQKTQEVQKVSVSSPLTPTPSPYVMGSGVTLTVFPQKQQVQNGGLITVSITSISAKPLLAIDLHLAFDGNALQLQSMSPGDLFQSPIILAQKMDNASGTALFSLGSTTPSKTNGTVATFSFKALRAQPNASVRLQNNSVASTVGAEKATINVVNTGSFQIY